MRFRQDYNELTGATTCIHDISGMDELIQWSERLNYAPGAEMDDLRAQSAAYGDRPDFTGTASLEHAIQLGREGWPEGVQRLGEAAVDVDLDDFDLTSLPQPYYDLAGEEVDVGRYLTNEPEAMIAYNMSANPNKTIEVVVEGIQSYRTTKEQIIGRGVGILASMQALQARGFSVGVTFATALHGSITYGSSDRLRSEYYVPLQEPGDVADVDSMAFALLHPSMLRRFMFAAYEQIEPEAVKRGLGFSKGEGYGRLDHQRCLPETDNPRVVIPYDKGLTSGPAAAQSITNMMIKAVTEHEQQG